MTIIYTPRYRNRVARTTTSEFRHLLKDGETSFHQLYARMEKEYDAWLKQFFIEHPDCSPDDFYEEHRNDPYYIQDVDAYIRQFYDTHFDIQYSHVMMIPVSLPEQLAEKVLQAAKSQGKSVETIAIEAIAKQFDLLDNVKDQPK